MLFEMAGETSRFVSIMQYFVTYLFMAILTLVAIGLVDRAGRRPLWLVASALMAVVTALAGVIFHQHLSGSIVLVVILLCAMPHGLALGPLPWLMMSEIFPNRIRAKMVAVTTTFLWITIFLGAQLFPLMTAWSEKMIGSPAGAFWILTFIDVLAFVFGWTMLPETKGRTLEAIAASWGKRAEKASS